MKREDIREVLLSMADVEYREFSSKLMPTVEKESVIGVRVPALRTFAKELVYDRSDGATAELEGFLADLPHRYFEENDLHAFIISEIDDFDECIGRVEEFLPFVDNWATCDSFRPRCFAKNRDRLPAYIYKWISSDKPYTVRFAIEQLMLYFLDDAFSTDYPDTVSRIRSDEYYVNMMIAWYFATALAKQYDSVIPYIENRKLPAWVHNKAISKATESFRISSERKKYLKTLKIKNM